MEFIGFARISRVELKTALLALVMSLAMSLHWKTNWEEHEAEGSERRV